MSHLEELDPDQQTGDSWCSLPTAQLSSRCNPGGTLYDSAPPLHYVNRLSSEIFVSNIFYAMIWVYFLIPGQSISAFQTYLQSCKQRTLQIGRRARFLGRSGSWNSRRSSSKVSKERIIIIDITAIIIIITIVNIIMIAIFIIIISPAARKRNCEGRSPSQRSSDPNFPEKASYAVIMSSFVIIPISLKRGTVFPLL